MIETEEFFQQQAGSLYTAEEMKQVEFLHTRRRVFEKCQKYDILELTALTMAELIDIAAAMGLTVGDARGKQTIMYSILEKQAAL